MTSRRVGSASAAEDLVQAGHSADADASAESFGPHTVSWRSSVTTKRVPPVVILELPQDARALPA